jgi:glutaryl-CoA dehydrogenase
MIQMDAVEVGEDALLPRRRVEGTVRLPQPCALRHFVGRSGGGGILLHAARQYGLDRKQFGRPLATQLYQRSSRT